MGLGWSVLEAILAHVRRLLRQIAVQASDISARPQVGEVDLPMAESVSGPRILERS